MAENPLFYTGRRYNFKTTSDHAKRRVNTGQFTIVELNLVFSTFLNILNVLTSLFINF